MEASVEAACWGEWGRGAELVFHVIFSLLQSKTLWQRFDRTEAWSTFLLCAARNVGMLWCNNACSLVVCTIRQLEILEWRNWWEMMCPFQDSTGGRRGDAFCALYQCPVNDSPRIEWLPRKHDIHQWCSDRNALIYCFFYYSIICFNSDWRLFGYCFCILRNMATCYP